MKNKLLSIFISISLMMSCLALLPSCNAKDGRDGGDIKIVCSVFPLYDWVSNIVGGEERVSVSLLVSGGGDLHSYEPSAADIIKLADCDMVIYVGGESDAWLTEALDKNPREDRREISLIEYESITKLALSDEFILGDEQEHEHEHEHEHGHGEQTDEHIWLSPNNAKAAVNLICDVLCELDAENAETYEENLEKYLSELDSLGELLNVPKDTSPLIFADRFPFVYLFHDNNIPYYAAFSGCTAEVDATFDTIIRLASLADELSAEYILVTESPIPSLAETVIETTKAKSAKILSLDSMQSVTLKDMENGVSYISIMKNNLEILASIIE